MESYTEIFNGGGACGIAMLGVFIWVLVAMSKGTTSDKAQRRNAWVKKPKKSKRNKRNKRDLDKYEEWELKNDR